MKAQYHVLGAAFLSGVLLSVPLKGRTAKAELADAQGKTVGTATFKSVEGGVQLSLQVENLPPGAHAMHIHAVGKCKPPDFSSAGPHFNPHQKKHGMKNPQGAHAGDLPNFVVSPDGRARVKALAQGVTLGAGENSLLRPGGTALVIHAGPDDDLTDPAGNAGPRIACGVITTE